MSSEHIVRAFDDQLRRLDNLIAEMGGLAEAQLADAIDAMSKRDLEKAKQLHEEAFQLRGEVWSSQVAAQSRLALAQLAIKDGEPESGLAMAREVLSAVEGQNTEEELRARVVVAVGLLETQRLDELSGWVRELDKLISECQSVPTRLWASLHLARCRAALGDEKAAQALEAVQAESDRRGFRLLEQEARLALANLAQQAEYQRPSKTGGQRLESWGPESAAAGGVSRPR